MSGDKPPSRCTCGYIIGDEPGCPDHGKPDPTPHPAVAMANEAIRRENAVDLSDYKSPHHVMPELRIETEYAHATAVRAAMASVEGREHGTGVVYGFEGLYDLVSRLMSERDAANALVTEIRTAYEKVDLERMTEMRRAAGLERELAEMKKRAEATEEERDHAKTALKFEKEVLGGVEGELATVTAERDSMRAQRDCAAELFEASCGDYNRTLLERDAMRPVIEAARAWSVEIRKIFGTNMPAFYYAQDALLRTLDAAPVSAPEVKPECGSGYCDRCGNMKTECRCAPFVPDAPKPPRSNKAKEDPAATFARAAELQREACADRVKLHYGPCPASDEVTLCELVAYLPQEPAACPKCDEREHYNSLDGCYCCDLVPREELDRVRAELEKLRAENGPSRVAERQRHETERMFRINPRDLLTGEQAADRIAAMRLVTDALKPDYRCPICKRPCSSNGCTRSDCYVDLMLPPYGIRMPKCREAIAAEIASWPGFEGYESLRREAVTARAGNDPAVFEECDQCASRILYEWTDADGTTYRECGNHSEPPGGSAILRTVDRAAAPPSREKDAGLCAKCGEPELHPRHDLDDVVSAVCVFEPRAADAPDPAKVLPAWRYDVTGREITVGDEVSSEACDMEAFRVKEIDQRDQVFRGRGVVTANGNGSPSHLRIVDPPAETAALDEWTDEMCERGPGPWLNSRWQDALSAIKRRNAALATAEADRRRLNDEWQDRFNEMVDDRDLQYRRAERLEAALAAMTAERDEEVRIRCSFRDKARLHDKYRSKLALQRRELRRLNDSILRAKTWAQVRDQDAQLAYSELSAALAKIDQLESALAAEKGKEEPAEAYRRGYGKGWMTFQIGTVKFSDTYSPPEPRK